MCDTLPEQSKAFKGVFHALSAIYNTQACSTHTSLTAECRSEGNRAIQSKSRSITFYTRKNVAAPQVKVLPRLELGSLDSKSKVLTIAPQGPLSPMDVVRFSKQLWSNPIKVK